MVLMRKLCHNYDKEDGLDTVLEVPIPEEMFTNMGSNAALRWRKMRSLMMRYHFGDVVDKSMHLQAGSNDEFLALLKLVGSPLIPLQVNPDQAFARPIKNRSIEASTAKYIVQQYVAAAGGPAALSSLKSMYAVGQVNMTGSEMQQGDGSVKAGGKKEVGGFVLWQKNPDLWYLELVVSGYKVSAGSDGKVTWNQSSCQPSHANRGPPRSLRRFFQGLDPRSTANLFMEAICIGEKTINKDPCFVLKLETDPSILKRQASSNTEIVHHTIWGYFCQRTGYIIKLEDTKLVKMKPLRGNKKSVFWETSIESIIEDYKHVELGTNVAHSGKTTVTFNRYGGTYTHKRMIEEKWSIEEVGFNVSGLSMECFLPPADLEREPDPDSSPDNF